MKVFFRGFWDSHVNERRNARYNMILSSDFLYFFYRRGFGGEAVRRSLLVSDKQNFPVYSTSIPTNGKLLSDGSSLLKCMYG